MPHGAAAAAIDSMIEYEGRKRGSWRGFQFSNYIFDASVLEIFNTLNSGTTLCVASNDRLLSNLVGVINEMMVTQHLMIPTVARLLAPRTSRASGRSPLAARPLAMTSSTSGATTA